MILVLIVIQLSLSIEITNNESENIILNVAYRPSDGDIDVCDIFFKGSVISNNILLARDFNINLLYFEQNIKVQNFINFMFQFGLVPKTNKPKRITIDTISAIDHIVTNAIINKEFKITILTADMFDHFPIIYAFKLKTKLDMPKTQFLYKGIINEN